MAGQFRPQVDRLDEMHALHPERAGGLDVAGAVVDEDAVCGDETVAVQQDAVDRRVGLDDALMRGDDDTVEALQEGEADQALGPFLAREIGDGIDLVAAPLQLLQHGNAVLDHAGHGLVPALVIGPDLAFPFRVAGDEQGDALLPAAAAILLEVPGGGADVLQEPGPLLVIGNHLAIDPERVPADQDIADIEDDGGHDGLP